MSWALSQSLGLVLGGLLAGGVAAAGRPWLARGGHRVDEDGDGDVAAPGSVGPPPRALWLLPATTLAGGVVGWARAIDGAHLLFVGLLGVMVGLLGLLTVIDLDVHRLPNVFTGPMALGTALVLTLLAAVTGDWAGWRRALLAGVLLGVLYLVLALIGGSGGMGLGDVKLAPTLGMLLGHLSWASLVAGTMATFLLGGLAALWLIVARGASRSTHLAFGPAMVGGTLLTLAAPGAVSLW